MNHLRTTWPEFPFVKRDETYEFKFTDCTGLHWIEKCKEHVHYVCNSNDKLCYPKHVLNTFKLTFYIESTLHDLNAQLN
jgi:hypothetical protein